MAMDLLFKREQSSGPVGTNLPLPNLLGLNAPKFKLWAKIELEADEQAVMDHYHFDQSILIDGFQPELIRKTASIAAGAFVAGMILFWIMFGFSTGLLLGLIVGGATAYFYYDKKRETIFVRDLLHGRYFSCGSVIELARKEAWLETITAFLRQVMESAKHWDGTETIKIEAMPKELAKQIMIKGL
jgi:hypothetical protein